MVRGLPRSCFHAGASSVRSNALVPIAVFPIGLPVDDPVQGLLKAIPIDFIRGKSMHLKCSYECFRLDPPNLVPAVCGGAKRSRIVKASLASIEPIPNRIVENTSVKIH